MIMPYEKQLCRYSVNGYAYMLPYIQEDIERESNFKILLRRMYSLSNGFTQSATIWTND